MRSWWRCWDLMKPQHQSGIYSMFSVTWLRVCVCTCTVKLDFSVNVWVGVKVTMCWSLIFAFVVALRSGDLHMRAHIAHTQTETHTHTDKRSKNITCFREKLTVDLISVHFHSSSSALWSSLSQRGPLFTWESRFIRCFIHNIAFSFRQVLKTKKIEN